MIFIIGSGPSAMSAAKACVLGGKEITILDVGYNLNSAGTECTVKPDTEDVEIPVKTTYKSTYPYWTTKSSSYDEIGASSPRESNAQGGFTSVWGAGVLPWMDSELMQLPFPVTEMKKAYSEVNSYLPMVARNDRLSDNFPLYSDFKELGVLDSSSQFKKVFKKAEANAQALEAQNVFIGKSRLAVQNKAKQCTYCAKCIDGCPEHIIYSAAHTLSELLKNPSVTYLDGVKVEEIVSCSDGTLEISGWKIRENEKFKRKAEKVFLGTGAIATAKIVLQSLKLFNHSVEIKDSQYFLLPALGPFSKSIGNEAVFTLSQGFAELLPTEARDYRIHLSMYGYSPFMEQYILSKFGPVKGLMAPFVKQGLGRLYILQGYLPSYHSGSTKIEMRRTANGKNEFVYTPNVSAGAKHKILGGLKHFAKQKKNTGLMPILPALKIPEVGKGYHFGASFPMSENPQSLNTNILGELNDIPGMHIVDSSVLPEIESGPMTYTMMANAFRIAKSAIST